MVSKIWFQTNMVSRMWSLEVWETWFQKEIWFQEFGFKDVVSAMFVAIFWVPRQKAERFSLPKFFDRTAQNCRGIMACSFETLFCGSSEQSKMIFISHSTTVLSNVSRPRFFSSTCRAWMMKKIEAHSTTEILQHTSVDEDIFPATHYIISSSSTGRAEIDYDSRPPWHRRSLWSVSDLQTKTSWCLTPALPL